MSGCAPIRSSPPEKIQEWTGINKEVVYIFLGPGGNMTTDPTIKPVTDRCRRHRCQGVAESRPHEGVRRRKSGSTTVSPARPIAELKHRLRRAAQERPMNYEVKGEDPFCKKPIADPRKAGEVWVDGEGIEPSQQRGLHARRLCRDQGRRARRSTSPMSSMHDARHQAVRRPGLLRGRLPTRAETAPFLLKKDAEAYAAQDQRQGARLRRRPENGIATGG